MLILYNNNNNNIFIKFNLISSMNNLRNWSKFTDCSHSKDVLLLVKVIQGDYFKI